MSVPDQIDLVAGSRRRPKEPSGVVLCHPDTGDWLADGLATDAATVEQALAAADELHASGAWHGLPLEQRATALEALADAVDRVAPSLGVPEALSTGIPAGITSAMTGGVGGFFRGGAAMLRAFGDAIPKTGRHGAVTLHRAPRGPAVVLGPWNAPSPVNVGRTAFALAAGCPVILKPSEWAPFTADLVAEALAGAIAELGLPPAVVQVVHGGAAVGSQLVADPRVRVVSFTGGLRAGRAIAALTAPNFTVLQLELGGNNPAVVRADAEVGAAARALAAGMTKLNGQWCEAPGKLLVHRSIVEPFLDALLAALAERTLGPCMDAASAIGPMAYEARRDDLHTRIGEAIAAGAIAHRVHVLPELGGWFVAPTVLTGLPAAAARDELFGPVVTLHPFDTDEEAVAMANEAGDGLAGFVFSTDVPAAMALGARLRGGEVRVNGTGLFDLCDDSTQSFWGTSGLGGHGDVQVFELFRGSRIVGEDDPLAPM